ncbi:MAG: HD-GYP domain-containing protein [Elusimicrobia bacterium]|nr:HD-GYP domain-containing protein [Elusimicrobiota bacterium]
MPWLFWTPAVLCLLFAAALAAVLHRLYRLKLDAPADREAAGGALEFPEGWEKLDELLSILLNLQEYGVSHAGTVSREDFARSVLDISCQLMSCARGSIMLWDNAAGCLRIVAAKSAGTDKSQKLFFKPGEGVAGKAFASGQAIFVANPEKDPRYVQARPEESEPFISIPLLVKSKPVGVLNLHATDGTESFTGYKAKFLNILAGEAAVMLHNQDLLDNLQTFYLEMVQTLARAVDSKDAYTREHSDRARSKARRLASELKLPDQMSRYIEYAALLHDIGKIGIDQSILLKPGKLTPEEYEVMKRHPIIGHQILAPVKYLGPVAQMVLYHQEWYDGRGYPEGLKGEEIPMGARMVAVIDAWDAMRSDRPYRKALSREAATAELRRCAGTQFDPKIVEAFLKIEAQAPAAAPREG